nr:MAG TPA: hypothetical protein [Caudoviricetes sp.]
MFFRKRLFQFSHTRSIRSNPLLELFKILILGFLRFGVRVARAYARITLLSFPILSFTLLSSRRILDCSRLFGNILECSRIASIFARKNVFYHFCRNFRLLRFVDALTGKVHHVVAFVLECKRYKDRVFNQLLQPSRNLLLTNIFAGRKDFRLNDSLIS